MQDFDAWIESLKQHRLYYQYKCLEQSSFPMHRHQASSNATTMAASSNNRNSANLLSSSGGTHSHLETGHHLKHNNSFAAFTTTNTPNNQPTTSSTLTSSTAATAANHAKSNSNSSNISSSQINNSETSRNLEIINQINANKKLIPADDQILDQVFKNVEDNLMSLSKILSSLYLQSVAAVTPPATNQQPVGYLQPPQPHHSHQASTSSFDFLTMMNTMNLQHKLHSSKSNPNLVINEVLSLPTTTSNLPTVNGKTLTL